MENFYAFIVAVLSTMVTTLIAWQIWKSVSLERRVEKSVKQEAAFIEKKIKAGVLRDITLTSASRDYDFAQSYYFMGQHKLSLCYCMFSIESYLEFENFGEKISDSRVDGLIDIASRGVSAIRIEKVSIDERTKSEWICILSKLKDRCPPSLLLSLSTL